MPFCFAYTCINLPIYVAYSCNCPCIAHCHEGYRYCIRLTKDALTCFNLLSGTWDTKLRVGIVHRPNRVNYSLTVHMTRQRNNAFCFVVCLT